MENDQISNVLITMLGIFICILILLVIGYIVLLLKNRNTKKKMEKPTNVQKAEKLKKSKKDSKKLDSESIMKFMQFEDIVDNMIVQKKGSKYLMVIECQGVNYDLMSEMEQVSVEEGFIQFLNTLKHPIQIYIQTRSINLEKSIQEYQTKIDKIKEKYLFAKKEYENMLENQNLYKREDIQKAFFEFTKIRNLYEYGKDIIKDTKNMSLNKNILNKLYYIIVPYYTSDMSDTGEYNVEELHNLAFSELYTRCQSIMRTLTACGVNSKILSSIELVELLYMAYNREKAESYGIERALKAQYDQLYSTAPDVLQKKMKILDDTIERQAVEEAKSHVTQARKEIEKEIENKQNNMDKLIDMMAKVILEQNKDYVGEEVVTRAKENLEKENEEKGESSNVRKKRKTSRSQ